MAVSELLVDARQVSVSVKGHLLLPATDVSVGAGRVVAVVGPSGSGKTTLLSCLAGLQVPTSGELRVCGEDLGRLSARRRAQIRLHRVGFVYQHADLLPELSPVENVMLPALLAGMAASVAREQAVELLREAGVVTAAATAELSGGEAQRVALARALVTSPSLLLADEPTGSLDPDSRDRILGLMVGLIRSREMGALIVTHDPVVAGIADEVVTVGPRTTVAG